MQVRLSCDLLTYRKYLFVIELATLPIEIPPELLATGGTITIQKRKVSVTKTADPNTVHSISVPISNKSDAHSKLSTTTNINEPPGSKVFRRLFLISFFPYIYFRLFLPIINRVCFHLKNFFKIKLGIHRLLMVQMERKFSICVYQ